MLSRNLSQGSSDTGFFGSMEKEKRRKKLDEGRIDAEMVINELMEGVDLKQGVQEEAESKLKLYNGRIGDRVTQPLPICSFWTSVICRAGRQRLV